MPDVPTSCPGMEISYSEFSNSLHLSSHRKLYGWHLKQRTIPSSFFQFINQCQRTRSYEFKGAVK
jgi:hypothetical protein